MEDKFNILLSFPRSGNTWVRYIAEFISKRPTCHSPIRFCVEGALNKKEVIGDKLDLGVDIKKRAILVKRHRFDYRWDDWSKHNCRLVLLIRDYREAILRHAFASRKDNNIKEINKCIEGYIHCLSSYDSFDGDKMLLYYENIILNPRKEIERLAKFIGFNKSKNVDVLFSNFKHHKRASLNYYEPGTMTGGEPGRLNWHSQRANSKIINKIEIDIKSNKLYNKYLKRYK